MFGADFIKVKLSILYNPELTTDQKLLYSYLDNKIEISEFREQGIPYFYMSSDESESLCEGFGWSKKTLQRHLNELESKKLIQFERTSRGRKIYKLNFRLMTQKSLQCWDKSVLTLGQKCPNSWDKNVPPIEKNIKKNIGKDIDNTDDDFFESKITEIKAE